MAKFMKDSWCAYKNGKRKNEKRRLEIYISLKKGKGLLDCIIVLGDFRFIYRRSSIQELTQLYNQGFVNHLIDTNHHLYVLNLD